MRFSDAMDILFPRGCAICDEPAGPEFRYVCWNCVSKLRLISGPCCAICVMPVEGEAKNGFTCPACVRSKPSFDLARSAVRYNEPVQKLVLDFKYHRATWLAQDLSSLMIACFQTRLFGFDADKLVCVPLHPVKDRSRSYNQSQLLARRISAALRKPLMDNALVRTAQTRSQTRLTAADRKANVKGVFAARPGNRFKGLNVLLIDDVMTTGATLNECAHTIKEAGARSVVALTLARG